MDRDHKRVREDLDAILAELPSENVLTATTHVEKLEQPWPSAFDLVDDPHWAFGTLSWTSVNVMTALLARTVLRGISTDAAHHKFEHGNERNNLEAEVDHLYHFSLFSGCELLNAS